MAADGAGGTAGRIDEDGVGRFRRAPVDGVGGHLFHIETQPPEVAGEPLQPALRAVDGGDPGAGEGELRRLAAGGGAEVDHPHSRHRTEQPGGQGGSGILYPPGALVVAGQVAHRPPLPVAQAAGGEERGAQTLGPAGRVLPDGDVDGGFAQVRLGDAAAGVLAVGRRPRLPQPVGGVETGRVVFFQQGAALSAETPEHGVDQGLVGTVAAARRQRDAGVDGRVRRRFEEQKLAHTEAQDVLHRPCLGGQRAVQAVIDEGVDLAQAAQRRGHQVAGQGTVAGVQPCQPRMVVDRLVQRPLAAENGAEKIEGKGAGHGRAFDTGCEKSVWRRRASCPSNRPAAPPQGPANGGRRS